MHRLGGDGKRRRSLNNNNKERNSSIHPSWPTTSIVHQGGMRGKNVVCVITSIFFTKLKDSIGIWDKGHDLPRVV